MKGVSHQGQGIRIRDGGQFLDEKLGRFLHTGPVPESSLVLQECQNDVGLRGTPLPDPPCMSV
jgi:hypothetical protein